MSRVAPEQVRRELHPALLWLRARTDGLRARVPLIDRGWRATEHYVGAQGSLLAAAVTYYAFLSIFPLLALAFAAVGVLARVFPGAESGLTETLQHLLPGMIGPGPHQLALSQVTSAAATAAGLGLLGVLYAGVSWVSDLREGLVSVFGTPKAEQPGIVVGYLRDLGNLLVLGAILLGSLAVSGLLAWAGHAMPEQHLVIRWGLALASALAGGAVSALFFFAIFRPVAPPELSSRAIWQGALLGAILFEALKQVSGRLLASTAEQPAVQAFGISIVLLVGIYYFSRIVMLAAAWAAVAGPAPRKAS